MGKHKYKVILETAGETLNRSYYIVRVEKETFWFLANFSTTGIS